MTWSEKKAQSIAYLDKYKDQISQEAYDRILWVIGNQALEDMFMDEQSIKNLIRVENGAYLYTLMLYIEQNPLKANIVQELEAYPYSSYNYFLNGDTVPECLADVWIVQQYQNDTEAIRAFLNSTIDASQLDEMKKASSLVEAPNIEKKPDMDKLRNMLAKAQDTHERNKQIAKAYRQGCDEMYIKNGGLT